MLFAEDVNLVAVLIAALAFFGLGAIWYSPKVFGRYWMTHENIVHPENYNHPIWVYFAEFALDLLTAFVLAVFISWVGAFNWMDGLKIGLWIWIGFVLPFKLSTIIWGKKSFRCLWVNSGFILVGLLLMGAIIGALK